MPRRPKQALWLNVAFAKHWEDLIGERAGARSHRPSRFLRWPGHESSPTSEVILGRSRDFSRRLPLSCSRWLALPEAKRNLRPESSLIHLQETALR